MASLSREAREQAVVDAVLAGNVPAWSRSLLPIEVEIDAYENIHRSTVFVLQDYLAIGSDTDAVRMPMTPASAAQLCQHLNCSLPTTKLVDDIFDAAEIRLTPQPLKQDRDVVVSFLKHQQIIEQQLVAKPEIV